MQSSSQHVSLQHTGHSFKRQRAHADALLRSLLLPRFQLPNTAISLQAPCEQLPALTPRLHRLMTGMAFRSTGRCPSGALHRPQDVTGYVSGRRPGSPRLKRHSAAPKQHTAAAAATPEVGSPENVSAVIPWLLSNGARPKQCKLDVRDLGMRR